MRWLPLTLACLISTAHAHVDQVRAIDRAIIAFTLFKIHNVTNEVLYGANAKGAPEGENGHLDACLPKEMDRLQQDLDGKIEFKNKWLESGDDLRPVAKIMLDYSGDEKVTPEDFDKRIEQMTSLVFMKCPAMKKEIPALFDDSGLLQQGTMSMCRKLMSMRARMGECKP